MKHIFVLHKTNSNTLKCFMQFFCLMRLQTYGTIAAIIDPTKGGPFRTYSGLPHLIEPFRT
ncbi:hypothethical protein [Ralstonia solanacearum PSI07]|uniref:Uncharacterized protein n=1 Tax=blood disease bacterium R229 TaxID=741978 RepID=G2ZX38_9RALS|nr:hypothethical protein [Ralstonia solanacearum PSI07]CCA83601.1 hypothetical protein BDB_mp70054 [blood disease bacterium R229]